MRMIGCDLHAAQQGIAMLDDDTEEVVERTLKHERDQVREFYAALPAPAVVGIEATGSMGWFLQLVEELAIECRVGHPRTIRKAETRQQKHDRRDAALLLRLLAKGRFPAIGMPSTEYRDLRSLLLHRHQLRPTNWSVGERRAQHVAPLARRLPPPSSCPEWWAQFEFRPINIDVMREVSHPRLAGHRGAGQPDFKNLAAASARMSFACHLSQKATCDIFAADLYQSEL